MQEKEMITQPRTDTATLIKSCQLIWLHLQSDDEVASTALREIADRLEEQEATIKSLREELGKMTAMAAKDHEYIRHLRVEICNASAAAMGHAEAVKTIRAEIDLLNKRPKR
jgi:hypothetical protein